MKSYVPIPLDKHT